jgi:hypothetical protein
MFISCPFLNTDDIGKMGRTHPRKMARIGKLKSFFPKSNACGGLLLSTGISGK